MSFDLWYFIVVFIFQSVPAQAVLLFYYSQTLRKELYLEPSLMHVMLLIVMYNTVSEKAVAPHSSTLAWKIHGRRSLVGCSPWVARSQTRLSNFTVTFYFHALEKEMATHSSVLAWRSPGTGKPCGLPSMGSHRVGHDWSDLAAAAIQSVHHFLIVFFFYKAIRRGCESVWFQVYTSDTCWQPRWLSSQWKCQPGLSGKWKTFQCSHGKFKYEDGPFSIRKLECR